MLWIAFKFFMMNMRSFYTKKQASALQFCRLFNELQRNTFIKFPEGRPNGCLILAEVQHTTTNPESTVTLSAGESFPRNAGKKNKNKK